MMHVVLFRKTWVEHGIYFEVHHIYVFSVDHKRKIENIEASAIPLKWLHMVAIWCSLCFPMSPFVCRCHPLKTIFLSKADKVRYTTRLGIIQNSSDVVFTILAYNMKAFLWCESVWKQAIFSVRMSTTESAQGETFQIFRGIYREFAKLRYKANSFEPCPPNFTQFVHIG